MVISSLAVSARKGTRKIPVKELFLEKEHGARGDAHAGAWHRQVSLLAEESIERARAQGLDVTFGDFAENIATRGIDLTGLELGTRLALGPEAVVEVTQIGKECHKKCAIYYQAGDCIMPREGIFARVVRGGTIKVGDAITITPPAVSTS
jgi:MOSC domain-containing protein YiiM